MARYKPKHGKPKHRRTVRHGKTYKNPKQKFATTYFSRLEHSIFKAFLGSKNFHNSNFAMSLLGSKARGYSGHPSNVLTPKFHTIEVTIAERIIRQFLKDMMEANMLPDVFFHWCVRHAVNIIPHVLAGDYFLCSRWTTGKKYGVIKKLSFEDMETIAKETQADDAARKSKRTVS